MYTITRGPSRLATQRRTGPSQQIEAKPGCDIKQKPAGSMAAGGRGARSQPGAGEWAEHSQAGAVHGENTKPKLEELCPDRSGRVVGEAVPGQYPELILKPIRNDLL
uniref:MAPK regulated corepressor interacting protein 2-like isoform X1 n=1 Tax=Pristiophorus japonicus TaxID=55135 RepID=UPI00398E7D0A